MSAVVDDLLTVDQVAELFGCTAETIEQETRERRLPGLKLGRSWRYPREALMRVVNERALAEMQAPAPNVTPLPQGRRGRRQSPPQLPAAASRAAKS
jgi:excisionase family DNA binding protein